MDEIWSAAQQIGYPIVISLYLMVRIEKKLEELKTAINNLSDKIDRLEVLDQLERSRNVNR